MLRLVRGELSQDAALILKVHVDRCPRCFDAYQRLSAGDEAASSGMTRTFPQGTPPAPVRTGAPDASLPRIEGYEILGVLAQGGMGIVYRAVQNELRRTVALKFLPAVIGSANPSAVERFRREATAAAKLHHTNIVPIYAFGECNDGYFYAMELVDGRPLNAVIQEMERRNAHTASAAELHTLLRAATTQDDSTETAAEPQGGPIVDSPATGSSAAARSKAYYQQVARWMADAAEALHYAHGQGVIHRDVKPSNLILSTDGRIMIADFGLAKTSDETSVTVTGSLLGTLRYLSPEQAMAKRLRVDHRTDIFSLGATMYELLAFQAAFKGGDDKEILAAIVTRDPPRPRKVIPSVPLELDTICMKGLEKAPDDRYATARALAEDLRCYLGDLPITARKPGPLRRGVKLVKRRKAASVAATVTFVLAISLALLIYVNQQWNEAEIERSNAEVGRKAAEIDSRINEGVRLMESEVFAESRARFEEALKLDGNNVRALYNFAALLKNWYNREPERDSAKIAEAFDYCERALTQSPNDADLLNLHGGLLKINGRLPEAIEELQRATQADPDHYPAWSNLGMVRALAGDLAGAKAALQEAARLAQEKEDEYYTIYAWRSLAAMQLYQGLPESRKSIDRAVRLQRHDVASCTLQARILLTIGDKVDVPAALGSAHTAVQAGGGEEPKAQRVLAMAQLADGNWQRALEHAQKAIDSGDMATINHLIRSQALAEGGWTVQAREELLLAVDAWPKELTNRGQFVAIADGGVLWFETADELLDLRSEVEGALETE